MNTPTENSRLLPPKPDAQDNGGPTHRISITASDGYALGGFAWRHPDTSADRPPVVIINAATSVRCRYYFRFANYLFEHGLDVIAYDYRGIGESRPATLRAFEASWSDWGALDFQAVLDYAAREFPGQIIDVVAHSFGGCALGLAASNARVRRAVTVGAQFAYWRDYAPDVRWRMLFKWHLAMPLLAMLYGYFPGKRLGWLEDTPRGVARDWSTMTPRFEERPSGKRLFARHDQPFKSATASILAIGATDDPFGTVAAIERLLAYFTGCERKHLRIAPADIGEAAIGHFAFFHQRFQSQLWPIALAWLQEGELPAGTPGVIIARHGPADAHGTTDAMAHGLPARAGQNSKSRMSTMNLHVVQPLVEHGTSGDLASACALRADALLSCMVAPATDDARMFATLIAAREVRGELPLLGMTHEDFCALVDRQFGQASLSFFDAGMITAASISPAHTDFVNALRRLLLSRASPTANADDAGCLASIIAYACLRPDHLWRDLGLSGREDVTRMLGRYFPDIVSGNVNNLRWKKYLAYELARANGSEPGPAPGCPGCEDYGICFPGNAVAHAH